MSLQVGYGLEGALPDITAFDITEHVIKPHFKTGDYAGGLEAGINAIMQAMRGEYKGTGKTVPEKRRPAPEADAGRSAFIIILLVLCSCSSGSDGNAGGYGYTGMGGPYVSSGWGRRMVEQLVIIRAADLAASAAAEAAAAGRSRLELVILMRTHKFLEPARPRAHRQGDQGGRSENFRRDARLRSARPIRGRGARSRAKEISPARHGKNPGAKCGPDLCRAARSKSLRSSATKAFIKNAASSSGRSWWKRCASTSSRRSLPTPWWRRLSPPAQLLARYFPKSRTAATSSRTSIVEG